jgi:hypothetical protein
VVLALLHAPLELTHKRGPLHRLVGVVLELVENNLAVDHDKALNTVGLQ